MDAITLLKKDHKTVSDLFERFDELGDGAHVQKREIVDRIIRELSIHAAIEETAFYPTAREVSDDVEEAVLESLEEHHVVKWLLSELEGMDPSHERFDAKVTVLKESVEHHVEEEEQEWFPKLRKALGQRELDELGEVLAKAKETAPTHPHPKAPDEGPGVHLAGALSGLLDRVRDAVSGRGNGSTAATRAKRPVKAARKGARTATGTRKKASAATRKAARKGARTATKRATAKRATAKRATAKRATAKRATAKRATAKRATAKRSPARTTSRSPAKKRARR
jgi:hemerythrin superfamily protein